MPTESFWPVWEAFLELAMVQQVTDGWARCTGVSICDAEGDPLRSFNQGQAAHFFYEFEIFDKIEVTCGGIELHNADGLLSHGKNSFQCDVDLPLSIGPGQHLRFHQVNHLDVGLGYYWFIVGSPSTGEGSYRNYSSGAIGHEPFAPLVHCRVADVSSFEVQFDEQGKLRHHGVANLKGDTRHHTDSRQSRFIGAVEAA